MNRVGELGLTINCGHCEHVLTPPDRDPCKNCTEIHAKGEKNFFTQRDPLSLAYWKR
jgi:hypothetical protein